MMESDINPTTGNTDLHNFLGDPTKKNIQNGLSLLKKDPPCEVNIQNSLGQTPLMLGVTHRLNELELIQTILERTNFDLKDTLGDTILHYWCKYGMDKCITDVLNKSNVLAENNAGEVALHHVYNTSMLKRLLEWYNDNGYGSAEKGWPANKSGKSELVTNLEDYLVNPDKLEGKRGVIEFLTNKDNVYPVPHDISLAIVTVIRKIDSESSESLYNILYKLLQFGRVENSSVLEEAIKKDESRLFHIIVEHLSKEERQEFSKDVLLVCLKPIVKKNGQEFFESLKGFIDKDQLKNVKDKLGNNVAHIVCKSGNHKLLKDLLRDQDVASQLFGATNNANMYPLACIKDKVEPEFLDFFTEYFESSKKGFENITLAKPTQDLLHYAIEKRMKYVVKLLEAGFPVRSDVHKKTPLHKMARHYNKSQPKMLEAVLSHQTEGTDHEYINKRDEFDFTALDYAILYKEEEVYKFLRSRGADFNSEETEKMIMYLAFGDKKYSASALDFILSDFEYAYPIERNEEYINHIERRLHEAEQAASDTIEIADSQNSNSSTIFNILIAHPKKIEVDPNIGQKESHNNQTLKHYHSLPLELLSLDHLDNFKGLINKKLFVVGEERDSLLMELLNKLLNVSAEHTQHRETVPERIYADLRSAEQLQLPLPSNELLELCPDKEIKTVEKKFDKELQSHCGVSGYFFCDENLQYYSRKFYSLPLDFTDIPTKEALASFKLLDVFYTEQGSKDYARRINSSWCTGSNTTDNCFDLEVHSRGSTPLNVSRFATPLLCSVLVSKFLCIPRDNKLLILSPDVLVSFNVHTNQSSTESDFIRVEITGTKKDADKIWSYFFSMLQSVQVKRELRGFKVLQRIGKESIFEAQLEAINSVDAEQKDLESAPLKTPENKTDPVEGTSLLYTCLDKLTKVSFTLPTQKYFSDLDPECDFLKDNSEDNSKLLHRLVLVRKDITVREFVQIGGYKDEEREAICKGIGIDVGETYSKLQNCWRLNWVDFLLLGIGVLIVVAILVGCEKADIDLESYGVAGIATVPFVLAMLNRVRLSYSFKPDYSKLPDIHNPGGE